MVTEGVCSIVLLRWLLTLVAGGGGKRSVWTTSGGLFRVIASACAPACGVVCPLQLHYLIQAALKYTKRKHLLLSTRWCWHLLSLTKSCSKTLVRRVAPTFALLRVAGRQIELRFLALPELFTRHWCWQKLEAGNLLRLLLTA